jgi:ribosome-binding factor A
MTKSKIEQLNQSFKKALGEILIKEFPDVSPLYVTDFLINPSFTEAKVFLRTNPSILKKAEERRIVIQGSFKNHLKTRYTPVLKFQIDDNYLENLDNLFELIDK